MGRLLLVRHGQASFGADDYDVLSDVGHEQAAALGASLTGTAAPDLVLAGALRRQQDTASGLVAAAGWDTEVGTDARWDEFDHVAVTAAHGGDADMRTMDRRTFQAAFERATARWSAGEEPAAGLAPEPWTAFVERVRAGLDATTAQAGPGRLAVAVSSGGPIALAAGLLLGLDAGALATAWARLNTVLGNASVSTVLVGSTGPRLLTWNALDHLPPSLLTYR